MRFRFRTNRVLLLMVSLTITAALIVTSITGTLSPVEGVVMVPLNFISNIFNDVTRTANLLTSDLTEIQELQDRNAELEEALALFQAELVELREIASDYQRLAELVDYTSSVQNQETVAAEVIGYDQNSLLRTIVINRGARDGIARGMPIVTTPGTSRTCH